VQTKIYYIVYQKFDKFIISIVYCFDYYISLYNCRFCFENIKNFLLQLIRLNIIRFKKKQEVTRLEIYNYFI